MTDPKFPIADGAGRNRSVRVSSSRPPMRTIAILSIAALLLLLAPGGSARGQGSAIHRIITAGLSQTINWLPESDSILPFRQNNGSAESLATLGSEISLAFELFPSDPLTDSASAPSVQLVTGYLQRGYRVVIASSNECLRSDVYRTRAAYLRIGLFGRNNIPIARGTSLVWQLGGTYATLISAFDNIDDIQTCSVVAPSAESVLPHSFFEAGAGLGIRSRISRVIIGSFNLLYFHPIAIAQSDTRPPTAAEARSLLVDVRTPNLSIALGLGWTF